MSQPACPRYGLRGTWEFVPCMLVHRRSASCSYGSCTDCEWSQRPLGRQSFNRLNPAVQSALGLIQRALLLLLINWLLAVAAGAV